MMWMDDICVVDGCVICGHVDVNATPSTNPSVVFKDDRYPYSDIDSSKEHKSTYTKTYIQL